MKSKRKFSLILIIILFLSVLLVSCARYNLVTIKSDLRQKNSEGHYIDGLHYLKQVKNECGPAVLATVLKFWQDDISQQEISKSIYLSNIKGSLTFDLENYAFKRGYFAQSLQSDAHDLGEKIKLGIPVIIMQQVFPIFKKYHYIVVFGYDDTNELILACTGKEEAQLISYFNFIRKWRGAGYWMLVICPPEKVNWQLDSYYLNRLGFLYEEKGNLETAKKKYQEAFDLEPDNVTYLYNLANIYLKEKDYQGAISLYEKTIALDDKFADSYNNLAYCLLESNQDLDKAIDLLDKAIELNPKHKMYYLDTLGMIYLKKHLFDKAILTFREALKSTKASDKDVVLQINEHLEKTYKLKGD